MKAAVSDREGLPTSSLPSRRWLSLSEGSSDGVGLTTAGRTVLVPDHDLLVQALSA